MELFRLARAPFAKVLSGKGAAIKGARWNSIGVEIIYTASNRSLAMAELAVHLTLATLPDDFMMITIDVPKKLKIKTIDAAELPKNWNEFPYNKSTQKIGDQFIQENKYCLLKVPSAVTKGDFNILLNPNHPDFSKIKIKSIDSFPFDQRIFK